LVILLINYLQNKILMFPSASIIERVTGIRTYLEARPELLVCV